MESGAATRGTDTRAKDGQSLNKQRKPRHRAQASVDAAALNRLLAALVAMRDGNFRKRLTVSGDDVMSEIAAVFNEVADRNLHLTVRSRGSGAWSDVRENSRNAWRAGPACSRATAIDASNALVDDLVRPVSEVGRVLSAVADGDLEQRMELRAQGSDGNGIRCGASS
ncbi:histidine kinase OS=Streptomyces alboniger OX=132473 GN=CP975_26515 PE=4 SV=1 [Streptomyces alboniger]